MSTPHSPKPPAPIAPTAHSVPIAQIVALVGKGMTVREILSVFPQLESEDIRSALRRAAELLRDDDASLISSDRIGAIIRKAQLTSGLSEDEAISLAVTETNAVRQAQAAQRK